ncbi:MAG: flagellar motor protein MotB [Thermobacillus sp. ZCTH02-B1]|uniref:flagellar motor protein MotB n=1 Tax=Thermobacillus sp. ZCTH02-B1 TaxID=1858795 RepID=UPI000B551C93|nr:flagellar motor protein MotB [Thermobacillus sp. ZCTH02-B1]OUM94800.1 MAG: flagellar motor protein MotB [Thermobacillus sp. ZCTH02-B1]
MSKRYRREEQEEHPNETWLVPYADLLTLLLALFIVMYAISSVDVQKFQEMSRAFNIAFHSGIGVLDQSAAYISVDQMQNATDTIRISGSQGYTGKDGTVSEAARLAEQELKEFRKLHDQISEYIRQNNLTTELDVQLNHTSLLIVISDNALFASGKADLTPEARELGVAIGQMLKNFPGYEISVEGHTDNRPIHTREFESNYELSAKRAINFMRVLIEAGDLDPRLVSSTGYGEFRPVATNDTPEGRAKNRRVEVKILRKFTDTEAAESMTVSSDTDGASDGNG